MREMMVGARTASGEDGRQHRFEYFVLIGEMEVAGHLACESYGVKIRERGGDTAALPNLTVSAGRIDSLLTLLKRNTVGPAGVRDVVDDWL